MILKKIELVEIWKECYLTIFVIIRPHHSKDGSTYPGYRLMCFVNISFFRTEQNAPAFNRDSWCHLASCLQMIPLSILNNNYQVLTCFGLLSSLYCIISECIVKRFILKIQPSLRSMLYYFFLCNIQTK